MTEKQIAMVIVAPMIVGMIVLMWRQGAVSPITAAVVGTLTVLTASFVALT